MADEEPHIVHRTPPPPAHAPAPAAPAKAERIEVELIGGPHHGLTVTMAADRRTFRKVVELEDSEAVTPSVELEHIGDSEDGLPVVVGHRQVVETEAVFALYERPDENATRAYFKGYE